jgi:hypothetical protein
MDLTDAQFRTLCGHVLDGNLGKVREYLNAGGDPNRLYLDQMSLGHHALRIKFNDEPHFAILRVLLEHGMSVNIGAHTIPLLHICRFPAEVKILIEAGLDVNAVEDDHYQIFVDEGGLRPIFSCVTEAHYHGFVRVLLANGADLALTNAAGEDVEAYARRKAHDFDEGNFRESGARTRAAADFIAEVKRAGSWKAYLKAPRVELVRLRSLCDRGRAAPPPDPILQRLFANVAASTSKPARTRRPLPNGVFWHVLQFWRTDRDGCQ